MCFEFRFFFPPKMRRVLALWCVVLMCMAVMPAQASVGFGACKDQFINDTYPAEPAKSVRICRDGIFGFSYDVEMLDPAWSAYYITPEDLTHTISGRDDFYEDPDLTSLNVKQPAVDSPAFGVDWNRGHLAPNHILSYSDTGKHASFTIANVAPQEAYFNQHPWNELEQKVYDWVAANKALHIVTGIAFVDRSKPTRRDGVAVPEYYWKVLCDAVNGQSVGFIGENWADGDHSLKMRPVTDVEAIYGGVIFPDANCRTSRLDATYWW